MATMKRGSFKQEHVARWLRISRDFLINRRGSAPGAGVGRTTVPARPAAWAWLMVLCCGMLPIASPAAEPLALKGVMQDMGRNMQAIVDGLSHEDYASVEKAALAIANHPRPPASERVRVMSFIGSNAAQFKAFDSAAHDNAEVLAKAATGGDGEQSIAAFHKLQSSCLACHQAFRKPFQEHFYGQGAAR